MTVNNNNNDVQNALNAIEQQYQQLDTWIAQMHNDTQAIHNDTNALKTQVYDHHSSMDWSVFSTTGLQSQLNGDIAAKNADLTKLAGEIDAANHGAYGDLANAILGLTQGITSALANGPSEMWAEFDVNGEERQLDDLSKIASYLSAVVKSLGLEVEQQKVEAEVTAELNADPNNTNVQALMQQSIGITGQVSQSLGDLNAQLTTDFNNFQTAWNAADHDENGIHWWDCWFGDGDAEKAKDEAIKKNATEMMNMIGNLKDAIAPAMSKLTPDFQQITVALDTLIQKLEDLLKPNLSPEQMKAALAALNAAIMNIFVLVVGLLGIVQQDAAVDKAKNEETMSQASNEAAQMGIAASQLQEQKLEQDLKYASIMGTLMEAAKYTLMAVGAVAVPGVGSMVVGMLMIALEASGALGKLTDACAKSMGKLGAEIFVGGLEMIATVVGGAGLDKLASKVMETVLAEVVVKVLAKAGEEATVKASTEVAAKLGQEAADSMTPVIRASVTDSAELAAKKSVAMYLQKNGVALTAEWARSAWRGGVNNAVVRMVEQVAKTAAEEAATTSAQQTSQLLVMFGKDAAADLTAAETKLISELNVEVANAAAAKAMNVSVKDAAKVTIDVTLKTAAKRAGWTGLYALGSNDILVGIAEAFQKKYHKMSDADFDKLKEALMALEQLLAAIAQMGGSGAASQFMGAGGSKAAQVFMIISMALETLSTAASGVGSYGMYESTKAQGEATEEMGKIQQVLDVLFQLSMPMIDARRKQEAEHDNKQFQEIMQSTASLAAHSYDNLKYANSVLLA